MGEQQPGASNAGNRDPASAPGFLTAREAAARLGIAERTVRRAIARGDLPATKHAGAFRIAPEDLPRLRAARPAEQAAVSTDPARRGSPDAPIGDACLATGAPLPRPLTSFVGREAEVAAVVAALREPVRLLTLTGPGGVGKTRLALAAAAAVAREYPDGVRFVALDAVFDPALVAATVAHALGVREAGDEPIAARLGRTLCGRRMLLVLDNFEQVVAAAPFVAALLSGCPLLAVLVTSRVRLRVSGEREYALQPLRLGHDGRRAPVEGGAPSEAERLFADRARAIDVGFAASQWTADVAAICERLDGLPLAIELAAALVKVLTPAELLTRLERRLPLLTAGPSDAPDRLRTMRDAIAWSFDLLTDAERLFARRLSVFVGGFTLAAAERVAGEPAGAGGVDAPLALLARLVDKSLLRSEVVDGRTTRYAMLETIREYAGEELAASGEAAAIRRRHAEWCLALAEDAGPRAKQPGGAAWVTVLEREHPNLRVGLAWFLDAGDGPRLVRLAGSLWPFWHEHTYFAEGHQWLAAAIALGREAAPADLLRALTGAGTLAWYQTRIEQARVWHEQALALARASGDRPAEAFALINLSAPAMEYVQYDRARACLEAGLAVARAVGETEAASLALHNLGCLAWLEGDFLGSRQWNGEALALARAEGWDWLVPSILVNLGLATADLGEGEHAASLLRQGLGLGRARGNLWDVCTALEGLGRVDAGAGRSRRAVRLFGAAAGLRDEAGIPQSLTDRAYYGPVLGTLRGDLGADAFAQAWDEGRSMPWERAVDEALAPTEAGSTIAPPARRAAGHGLTARELEILRLLATGEGNRAISERLFISPRTVGSHVASILGKLGLQTRGQAAAYARRHDLA